MTTPDRFPGTREEEKLRLLNEGEVADSPGDVVYDGTVFSFRDAAGLYDPRTGTASGIVIIDQAIASPIVIPACKTVLFDDPDIAITGSVEIPADGNMMVI